MNLLDLIPQQQAGAIDPPGQQPPPARPPSSRPTPDVSTLIGRLAAFLLAHPNEWIDGRELAKVRRLRGVENAAL